MYKINDIYTLHVIQNMIIIKNKQQLSFLNGFITIFMTDITNLPLPLICAQ